MNSTIILDPAIKTYVVAVSGGVDSVALLDMLSTQTTRKLIVAHFDHGIREDSAEDALFVQALADRYGLQFETSREELGPSASEDVARGRRYEFLRKTADTYDARIMTAHHADDVVETIAINLHRGTGWRGVAVLDSDIVRPLLGWMKKDIVNYANQHGLMWREDSTNSDHRYLRNKIRASLDQFDSGAKKQLVQLRASQVIIKHQINQEIDRYVHETDGQYSRYFFTHIDQAVAVECLRRMTHGRLTRPQLLRALTVIKVAKPGTKHQPGTKLEIHFTSRNFIVELIK